MSFSTPGIYGNDIYWTIKKAVFANQLKTVIGEVMDNEVTTESGTVIDAIFGKLSVDNRIVGSVDIMGTTNTLLDILIDKAVKAYNT